MTDSLPTLTILEEFLLLALDDITGAFWPLSRSAFDNATAGAVIMDLMRLRRVDCDLHRLFVVNTLPTDDDILDPVLQALALEPVVGTRSIIDEVRFLGEEGEAFRERALQRLIERGMIKREDRKILWVFGERCYPVDSDNPTLREVKARILEAITGTTIPDIDTIMLVSLAEGCGLFTHVLNRPDLANAAPRIAAIGRMDLVGRAVATSITELETAIAMSSGLR